MVEDPNWFYSSVAQSAAAIVGLIGAFVTSKVMMMAGEKSQIENRINEVTSEINELENQNKPILEYINEIDKIAREKDEERVNTFLQDKKSKLDLENLPEEDEMLKEFIEETDINIPDDKFNTIFKEKYAALIKEIGMEKDQKRAVKRLSRIEKLRSTSTLQSLHALPPIITHPNIFNKRYYESRNTVDNNNHEISKKKAIIQELQIHVNRIALSKHFEHLIKSLIFFTIVGVVIPLALLPITAEQHSFWKPVILFLFIIGLTVVFLYIFFEIKYITEKHSLPIIGEEIS